MAVHPEAMRGRRLWGLVGAALVLVLALGQVGCSRQPAWTADQFVGRWKSTRLATRPIELLANGEWEIRSESGAEALQYGVWHLQDRTLVWTFRTDSGVMHDTNPILSVSPARFELRERDGSVTRFERVN
ncbi:hypothetical protein [Hydrogenophaga soli]